MDFFVSGDKIILTKIVRIIIAKATFPKVTLLTIKTNALKIGL